VCLDDTAEQSDQGPGEGWGTALKGRLGPCCDRILMVDWTLEVCSEDAVELWNILSRPVPGREGL
jgi:hypothetical protein